MIQKDMDLVRRIAGLPLTEGFHNLTVHGSDNADDEFQELTATVIKSLRKHLKDPSKTAEVAGNYNTPGYLNVAMIMTEKLEGFRANTEMKKLAQEVSAILEENKEHWQKSGLRADYARIQKKLGTWT